jgi:hypothetical protein
MNTGVPQNAGNFLTSFSRTPLHVLHNTLKGIRNIPPPCTFSVMAFNILPYFSGTNMLLET